MIGGICNGFISDESLICLGIYIYKYICSNYSCWLLNWCMVMNGVFNFAVSAMLLVDHF